MLHTIFYLTALAALLLVWAVLNNYFKVLLASDKVYTHVHVSGQTVLVIQHM